MLAEHRVGSCHEIGGCGMLTVQVAGSSAGAVAVKRYCCSRMDPLEHYLESTGRWDYSGWTVRTNCCNHESEPWEHAYVLGLSSGSWALKPIAA